MRTGVGAGVEGGVAAGTPDGGGTTRVAGGTTIVLPLAATAEPSGSIVAGTGEKSVAAGAVAEGMAEGAGGTVNGSEGVAPAPTHAATATVTIAAPKMTMPGFMALRRRGITGGSPEPSR